MDYIKLACLKCGQGNRVPKDKVYQGPKCASCGSGSMPSKVSELSPNIFEKAASKLSGKARLAKLNTEQYQTVATKLGIRCIPTLIGYHDGKEVFRKSGAMPAQQIEILVKTHAK